MPIFPNCPCGSAGHKEADCPHGGRLWTLRDLPGEYGEKYGRTIETRKEYSDALLNNKTKDLHITISHLLDVAREANEIYRTDGGVTERLALLLDGLPEWMLVEFVDQSE